MPRPIPVTLDGTTDCDLCLCTGPHFTWECPACQWPHDHYTVPRSMFPIDEKCPCGAVNRVTLEEFDRWKRETSGA